MTIMEMLEQSTVLTVLGMAIVFVFLWIMIVCINLAGKLVHKMHWDKDVMPPEPGPAKAAPQTNAAITAAITSAVTEYRKKNPQ